MKLKNRMKKSCFDRIQADDNDALKDKYVRQSLNKRKQVIM